MISIIRPKFLSVIENLVGFTPGADDNCSKGIDL